MRLILVSALLVLCSTPGTSQTIGRSAVRAVGTATVSDKPDQVRLSVGVVTSADTAQAASDQNASQTTAVLAALTKALGPNADIKTVNYSLVPNYRYPAGGGQPTLTGYTASNTVQITSADLAGAGRLIDTATQAGANTIGSLQFSLKDPEPTRARALRQATTVARAHADAMASGAGMRLGAVIAIQEGYGGVTPLTGDARSLTPTAATPTPVDPGTVDITATVTLDIALM